MKRSRLALSIALLGAVISRPNLLYASETQTNSLIEVGWFTKIHNESPNAMVDAGWALYADRKSDGSCALFLPGRREISEKELEELLAKYRGLDGVLFDASDDVPVSYVKKTLHTLQKGGQRHFVLFRRIEGVQSDFFNRLDKFASQHPSFYRSSTSNKVPQAVERLTGTGNGNAHQMTVDEDLKVDTGGL